MPPIVWILAIVGTAVLVWLAHRSNTKHTRSTRDYDDDGELMSELGELEAEIYRLRHVVVEQAVDSYVMLNVDSEQWRIPTKRVTRYTPPAARQLPNTRARRN